jgi:hypothetical protein
MFKHSRRSLALAAAAGVLVGGVLTTVTPADASLGINWQAIWKHEIKPRADKRYYTKTRANARYAPYPHLIRGSFMDLNGTGAVEVDSPIAFGVELATTPTVHYIKVGDPIPSGCAGTVDAPDASPGHLCVFEQAASNLGSRGVANPANGAAGQATTFGAYIYGIQAAAGQFWFRGTWALRPGTVVATTAALAASGGVNTQSGSARLTR